MTNTFRRHAARWVGVLAIATATMALPGCASPDVGDYAAERPALDLRTYFDGKVTAHGIFTDRSGRVVKRFVVDMKCAWQSDVGTLDETFHYSDGSTQRRVWIIKRMPGGRYSGTAADVVGQASGREAGNAFNWQYTLALPVDGTVWHVQLDDWMYLVDELTMLNKAVMTKFGIKVGEITLSFTKG